jgi:hypothetical protein
MKNKLRDLMALVAVTLALVWCIPSVGQVIKGSISGSVIDPQGAVVSGAQVKAKNLETGAVFTTTSDNSGNFRLNLIPVGTYTIEVTAQGFKTSTHSGVAVDAGSDAGVGSLKMSVGETSTTVEVSAEAPLIETTQAQVTNTFSGTTLQTFAGVQENEGLDRLALFVPGVVATRSDNFSNTNGVGFSSNGLRGRNNDQEIDGQNNNDNSVGGPGLFLSNPEFVQQYVIVTNNFGPEYGRNAGSVVNIITKSGSNNWHGSLMGEENNSFLNALSNTQRNTNKPASICPAGNALCNPFTGPPRSNNEFSGGTFGGPLMKNKLFLFSGLDDQIISGNTVYTSGSLTPTPSGLATLAGCFPTGAGAQAVAALTKFGPYGISAGGPTPRNITNVTSIAGCPTVQMGGVTRILATPAHGFDWVEKADLQLGSDTISGRYLLNRNNNFNTQDNGAAGYVVNVTGLSQSGLISWSHNFTSHMVNEARVAFGRLNVAFGGNNIGNPFEPTPDKILQAAAVVGTGAGNLGFGPANNLPQARIVNTWQAQDNWNYVLGKHNFKSGVNFTYQRSPNIFLPQVNGQYAYPSWNGYFNDNPTSISVALGNTTSDFREYDTFLYAGDDWKITQNLTLNLGLTWSYYGQPANLFHDETLARESNSATAFFNPALPLSVRTFPEVGSIKNSFGPSAGFAYSPQWGGFITGHGKTVLRGGYRLLYDPAFYNIYLNIASAAPQVFLQTLTSTTASPAANFPLPAAPTGPNVRSLLNSALTKGVFDPRTFNQSTVSPNFSPDRVHSWTFGAEREITKNTAFEARYSGNRGTNLFQSIDGNPFVGTTANPGLLQAFPNLVPAGVSACTTTQQIGPGAGTDLGRVNCGTGAVRSRTNTSYSDYNALQVEFRANNMFKQLTMRTGYTWSKTTDNVSEIFGTNTAGNNVAFAQNQFNFTTAEHSTSGLNIPQAWTIEFTEQLPFFRQQHGLVGHVLGGWSFSADYILASGQPYTPEQASLARVTDGSFKNGSLILPAFGNFYDNNFVATFAGADTARPFSGNPNAPSTSVGITAGDACLGFLGIIPTATNTNSLCNTTITPVTQLISLNAFNGPTLPGPGRQIVNVTNNDVRFIMNGRFAQQLFGTPFGNVARNSLTDAMSNVANVSVFKKFQMSERTSFEMHLTALNALNHFNYGNVDAILEDAGRSIPANRTFGVGFGDPSLTAAAGRTLFIGGVFRF